MPSFCDFSRPVMNRVPLYRWCTSAYVMLKKNKAKKFRNYNKSQSNVWSPLQSNVDSRAYLQTAPLCALEQLLVTGLCVIWNRFAAWSYRSSGLSCQFIYTGCFTTLGHNCRRWFPRFLWSKSPFKHVSDFGRLRSYGRFLIPVHTLEWTASNSWSTRDALLARIMDAADVIRNSELTLRATRAVHNRAAACVAAGGGIFENQL